MSSDQNPGFFVDIFRRLYCPVIYSADSNKPLNRPFINEPAFLWHVTCDLKLI